MDINRRLNDIILKYGLDRAYPRFRKKRLGEEKLAVWAKGIGQDRVLCIGTDQEDINYFSHLFFTGGKEFSYRLFPNVKEGDVEECDRIAVISRRLDGEMIDWCVRREKPVTFLYDELERQGVFCEDEIHKIIETDYSDKLVNDFPAKKGWRQASLMEFYAQRKKLAITEDKESQLHYIRKLFFLALYVRNFVQAEKYQKMLLDAGDLSVAEAWKEIQILLAEIRERLQGRQQEDIVMVWMDAVSYGTGWDMPYLQKQIENGISFENAFTVTPRTNPTAQALFLGKKLIDDTLYLQKIIREEESPVFLDLKNHGYSSRVISGYLSIFEQKLQSSEYHELYVPCSAIFWDVLCNLLSSDKPVFLLAHALTEGHTPHMTTWMEEDDFLAGSSRIHHGHQELDEQMEYYMEFLNKRATRIFMSDHGQHIMKEQFHTYFVITGEKFCHRKAKELFSYVDFYELIHEILEGNRLEVPLSDKKYAEVQMLDYYNDRIVEDIIRKKKPLLIEYFGYFGVITKTHLYLKYHIGKEFLAAWNHMEQEPHFLYQAHDICDFSLLPYFRGIIGEREINITKNEKFRYTHYLYQVYEKFMQKRAEVFHLVNQLFQEYPDGSVALRMGGDHSLEFFHALTDENQKKLAYIVDRNQHCKCADLGLPVISPEDMGGKGIRAVALSSFKHLEALRKEAADYSKEIAVIDIYYALEDAGIRCNTNFYAAQDVYMPDEIYDVEFPFDEEK